MKRRILVALLEISLLSVLLIACGSIPTPITPIGNNNIHEPRESPTHTHTVVPSHTSTLTPISPTNTSTPTYTPSSTNTPSLPPLVDIFPQVGSGEKFVYINNDGSLSEKFDLRGKCVRTGTYGIQLTYDMKGDGNGGWGVTWENSPEKFFNAFDFSAFSFWVKGTGGETFQIGIKDTSGNEMKIESETLLVVSSDWEMVEIPLSRFQGVNTNSINNVSFGFNQDHGTGSICIDDILFIP